jgi:hypothetical protein
MPTALDVFKAYLLSNDVIAEKEQSAAIGAGNPTILDRVKTNFARPNAVMQINQSSADFDELLRVVLRFGLIIGKVMQRVAELPPSSGYEPLLVEAGWNPFIARAAATVAVRRGNRCAKESKLRRPVFDAIRFLAQRPRQARAILRCAKLLVEAWTETSIIETLFDEAGLSETEFIGLLESVVEGREVDRQRIMEIAALVAPFISLSRGPKVTAPSVAHEFLLEYGIGGPIKRRPYSGRNRTEEYADPLTEATRREFNAPHFDARPARRRLKALRRAKQAGSTSPSANHCN